MKRWCALLAFCGIVTLLLMACSSTNAGSPSSNLVHMGDTNFVQSSITIRKGESVTLVADTFVSHVIANGTWDNGTPQSSKEPGAPVVDNVSVDGNSSATVGPFNTAGSFKLYCTIHSGMNLTVVVQ